MSNAHLNAVRPITGLTPATKFILWVMADCACDSCGLTWVGVKALGAITGLGRTRIQDGLEELQRADHVKIHAYATGGRGRSTEYIVLPRIVRLSTAPCGKCRENMKPPGTRALLRDKPTAPRALSVIPPGNTPVNRPQSGPQSSENQNPHRARAREVELPASPPATPEPPRKPSTPKDAQERAIEMALEYRNHLEGSNAQDGTPGGKNALIEATHRTGKQPGDVNITNVGDED